MRLRFPHSSIELRVIAWLWGLQARAVAQALRDGWREAAGTIYHLKRGKGDEDYEAETGTEEQGTLRRIDIEQFASTGGRVLVAQCNLLDVASIF